MNCPNKTPSKKKIKSLPSTPSNKKRTLENSDDDWEDILHTQIGHRNGPSTPKKRNFRSGSRPQYKTNTYKKTSPDPNKLINICLKYPVLHNIAAKDSSSVETSPKSDTTIKPQTNIEGSAPTETFPKSAATTYYTDKLNTITT